MLYKKICIWYYINSRNNVQVVHMYYCSYCMLEWSSHSADWASTGVRLPILLVVSRPGNLFLPCHRLRRTICSRETALAALPRASLLLFHTQADSGAYSRAPFLQLSEPTGGFFPVRVFKENLNASRPSEHPPVRGKNVKTRLGGTIGCKDKTLFSVKEQLPLVVKTNRFYGYEDARTLFCHYEILLAEGTSSTVQNSVKNHTYPRVL